MLFRSTIFVKILNDLGNFSSWIPCGKLKSCEQQGQHSLDALMSCNDLLCDPADGGGEG